MGFMDLRQWIALLEKEGELRRITAEVDWDREIGAIARRVPSVPDHAWPSPSAFPARPPIVKSSST